MAHGNTRGSLHTLRGPMHPVSLRLVLEATCAILSPGDVSPPAGAADEGEGGRQKPHWTVAEFCFCFVGARLR